MKRLVCNGWTIYFHPLFMQQWTAQVGRVRTLKSQLKPEDFLTHADVKLLKAIQSGIEEKIPQDPFAAHFALKRPLHRYGRLKKMGLPERYRLFFRATKHDEQRKAIIVLWLGFPRKEGDKNDCYQVFTRMVCNGAFPQNIDALIAKCKG